MADSKDVIVIAHSVHDDISEDEARQTLPPDWTFRHFVDICPARISLADTLGADWISLARKQRAQWEEQVRPLLSKYSGARLAYFGLAPIPLAIHLGSLTERWPAVSVFLRHHERRSWQYLGGQEPKVIGPNGPYEPSRSTDPVIVTVGTTVAVDIDAARLAVGSSSAEAAVRTDPYGEDVLVSDAAVRSVGEAFRASLALLEANRSGATAIHLFAAVPVGLAFLLGTYLTPTRTARLVTYQYSRSTEPRFREALRLPQQAAPRVSLSDDERSEAARLRAACESERAKLIASLQAPEAPWYTVLGALGVAFEHGAFGKLQPLRETPLIEPLDLSATSVAGEFLFDPVPRRWLLSDELLIAIAKRVPPERLQRAGRMLLLHEALHHGRQGLTASTATQIRFAPKVLEELDYLADVWAMLHEFAFAGCVAMPWAEQRTCLLEIVETAIATMWAFDQDREPGVLEVRRVNRYLIWYTVLARLERASSADEAMSILADKPVIDLVGPRLELRDERFVALLQRPAERPYELCMLDRQGALRRLGSTNATSVAGIATALGAHDGSAVRAAIRGFLEHT